MGHEPGEPDPIPGTPRHGGSTVPRQSAVPQLLSADTIAVIEHSRLLSARSYDLVAADGTPLGSVIEQSSAGSRLFGAAAASGFSLTDAGGALIATVQRPPSPGRAQFAVTAAGGTRIGTIDAIGTADAPGTENAGLAPQFRLVSADGAAMHLLGGSPGSTDWELTAGPDGTMLASIHQELAGLSGILRGTQRFAVRLSPALTGQARMLAVMAATCLDYLRDARQRR